MIKNVKNKPIVTRIASLSLIFVFALIPFVSFAHSGRTDSNGGHTCKTNCEKYGLEYGEYHYHNGGGSSGGSSGSSGSSGSTTTTPAPAAPTPTEEELYVQWVKDHYQNTLERQPTEDELNQAKTLNDKDKVDAAIKGSDEYKRKQESTSSFTVTRIVDGDTLEVNYFGSTEKVRLIGIDTPEKDQCYFDEASKALSDLVLEKQVKLVKDGKSDDKDAYSRLLRYIELNAEDMNAKMVKTGFAHAYLDYPFDRSEAYKQYEEEAKKNTLALWNPETCVVKAAEPETTQEPQAAPETKPTDDFERHYSGLTMFLTYAAALGGTIALGVTKRRKEKREKPEKKSKVGMVSIVVLYAVGIVVFLGSFAATTIGGLIAALIFSMVFLYFAVMSQLRN